ncbi:hypothetical protein SLE2022_359850 [Rubroshorea leprosula]
MEAGGDSSFSKASSLRWRTLRRAILPRASPQNLDEESQSGIRSVSRKAAKGFNLIPFQLLVLTQRVDNCAELKDFEICNKYNIDNAGHVCQWPSENVLAYFCLSHADMFRSKRIIGLGLGYALAGFVIAATIDALEVVISDGNPQVVDYIQHNIDANSEVFGCTKVKSMTLHWNHDEISELSNTFDVIFASDCTIFKEFHKSLARIVQCLLKNVGSSEAILFSPKRVTKPGLASWTWEGHDKSKQRREKVKSSITSFDV